METNVVGRTARVRARPRERSLVDDRAVRALRRDAPDGLQMAGPASGGRPRRLGRPEPRAAAVSPSDEPTRGSAPRRGTPGVRLGRQEAAAGAARTRHPNRALARTQHRQRDPRAPRPAPQESTAAEVGPSRRGPAPRRDRPNQIWPADFKGQFRTGDGQLLLSADRDGSLQPPLLACHGLRSVKTADAKPVFRALFRAVGLPDAIRTDNGAPFASTGIHGLSALNVWWMQLGIVHQRIPPASPQENGTHERMHRELKRETDPPRREQPARAAAAVRRLPAALQRRAPARGHRRSHADLALDAVVPSVSRSTVTPPAYPAHLEVRRVSTAGTFRLHVAATLPQSGPATAKTSASKKSAMAFGTSCITGRCSERSTSAAYTSPGPSPAR